MLRDIEGIHDAKTGTGRVHRLAEFVDAIGDLVRLGCRHEVMLQVECQVTFNNGQTEQEHRQVERGRERR